MTDLNYKNKYLKYKKKYLELCQDTFISNMISDNITNHHYKKKYLALKELKYLNNKKYLDLLQSTNNKYKQQFGGGPLSFISREDFNKRFLSKEPSGMLYLMEFIALYKSIEPKPELNILIGAANVNDYDFNRFKNSNYLLFIDNFLISNNKELYKERLYDMFTISNLGENDTTWLNYAQISNRLKNMVDTICTDINTAYFLDAAKHFALALKALKIGGKFIFYHVEHYRHPCMLNGSKFKMGNTGEYVTDELISLLTIDHQNKTVKVLGDENILTLFNKYTTNILACEFPIHIINEGKYYEHNLYEAYHRYLVLSFPKFDVNLHTFNFMNFTYPVPIPNETTELEFVRFIINYVMTDAERTDYLTTKTLTNEKLEELISRVINTQVLIDKLKSKITDFVFDITIFRSNVISEFTQNFNYYELIKNE